MKNDEIEMLKAINGMTQHINIACKESIENFFEGALKPLLQKNQVLQGKGDAPSLDEQSPPLPRHR